MPIALRLLLRLVFRRRFRANQDSIFRFPTSSLAELKQLMAFRYFEIVVEVHLQMNVTRLGHHRR